MSTHKLSAARSLILGGATVTAAAKAVSVSRSSLYGIDGPQTDPDLDLMLVQGQHRPPEHGQHGHRGDLKRTARKSAGDISWTMLRMRKKVEPQIAVMATSSSVATLRERAELTGDGSQTTVRVMVDPFGAWVPPSTDWSLTVPNIPPNTRST
jgi:transposase